MEEKTEEEIPETEEENYDSVHKKFVHVKVSNGNISEVRKDLQELFLKNGVNCLLYVSNEEVDINVL